MKFSAGKGEKTPETLRLVVFVCKGRVTLPSVHPMIHSLLSPYANAFDLYFLGHVKNWNASHTYQHPIWHVDSLHALETVKVSDAQAIPFFHLGPYIVNEILYLQLSLG